MIGDRWGVTDAETRRAYPCDAIIATPTVQAWRGVTVLARPEQVWPWVRQIRLAPYSYDVIDNGGRRSPARIVELRDPAPGDPFTAVACRPVGRVLAVDPGRSLTGEILGAVMSYTVEPEGPAATRTRLLLKLVMGRRARLVAPLVSIGDLVMARRQLLNWKQLAESRRAD